MYLFLILAALIGGLVPIGALADEDCRITMVPTSIGLSVTDLHGQPLSSADSALCVVWDQFGKRPWPEKYWAMMTVDTLSAQTLVPTRFPIDRNGVRYLWWYAKFFHKPKIKIGFYVLDMNRRPVQSTSGVRIVLWQLGADTWPQDLWVTIEGQLDQRGHIVVPVNFPLNNLVVKNLTTLARIQE